ncbi:hypothetical protein B0H13DRAFT_1892624 [Mycena leptocephala]|nr:hypothetical protein B0H13DRAFT_1892624 [Mycena leptocephala]
MLSGSLQWRSLRALPTQSLLWSALQPLPVQSLNWIAVQALLSASFGRINISRHRAAVAWLSLELACPPFHHWIYPRLSYSKQPALSALKFPSAFILDVYHESLVFRKHKHAGMHVIGSPCTEKTLHAPLYDILPIVQPASGPSVHHAHSDHKEGQTQKGMISEWSKSGGESAPSIETVLVPAALSVLFCRQTQKKGWMGAVIQRERRTASRSYAGTEHFNLACQKNRVIFESNTSKEPERLTSTRVLLNATLATVGGWLAKMGEEVRGIKGGRKEEGCVKRRGNEVLLKRVDSPLRRVNILPPSFDTLLESREPCPPSTLADHRTSVRSVIKSSVSFGGRREGGASKNASDSKQIKKREINAPISAPTSNYRLSHTHRAPIGAGVSVKSVGKEKSELALMLKTRFEPMMSWEAQGASGDRDGGGREQGEKRVNTNKYFAQPPLSDIIPPRIFNTK